MVHTKAAGKLKIFDPGMKAAAAAVMEPPSPEPRPEPAPGRKPGGRNVRISGYIPPELDAALRDEAIRRTVAQHRAVSLNDVLCDALQSWMQTQRGGQ